MRILLLMDRIPPENRGGAGMMVWRLALALRDSGHDVHVAAATEKAAFTEAREGIPTYHIHCTYADRWRAWLSLRNRQTEQPLRDLYRHIQPDVINAHNVHQYLSYHSLTLARQEAIPTLFSSHDVMPFAYHKINYFIDRAVCGVRDPNAYRLPLLFNLRQMRLRYNPLRNWHIRQILHLDATLRTTPSQALAEAHAANGLPPFIAVHNGIDPEHFQVAPQVIDRLRQRLGLQGRKVILFAGRLTGAKGTGQLLPVLRRVVEEVPTACLLVLSSVPLDEQIQQTDYADLLGEHIVAGGWLIGDELAAAYHLADVLVAPSIVFDTFPTVNLEGMAARKPVLASCYGGSREVVVDGETGYIINPFDTADFTAKLTRVLQDDALRQQMGAAGYERLLAGFTMEHHAQKMVALYEQAIRSSLAHQHLS